MGTVSGRTSQKERTRQAILEAAVRLIKAGHRPTVDEASLASGIPRRTAYRYYPSQDHLLTDAALESIRPEMNRALDPGGPATDTAARVDRLISEMHRLTIKYEPELRTIMSLSLGRTGSPPGAAVAVPPRGRRRIDWIETALSEARTKLDPAAYERLVSALTVVVGIDAYIILTEVRRLTPDAAERVVLWMGRALLEATLAGPGAGDIGVSHSIAETAARA